MNLLKYLLFISIIIYSNNYCIAQKLDDNQLSTYKSKIDEIRNLKKNNRNAQSYELIKEVLLDLKDIKNYSQDIVSLKSTLYLYASFCFNDDNPGAKYFYEYKKYRMELENTDRLGLYNGSSEKKEYKNHQNLIHRSFQQSIEIIQNAHERVFSKKFDFSSIDTSLFIYDDVIINKINEIKADMNIDLTVSGRGTSKDNAIFNALKLAINQGFSSFITTNTKIVNDSLINDEVIQMTSGTINKFTILTSDSISANDHSIVLKVLIGVNRMNDLVKSKGIESEFDGAEFAFNQKLRILNDQNEIKTLKSIIDIATTLFKKSIDYKVNAFDPIASIDKPTNWEIPINIDFKFNENIKVFSSYLYNNLKELSLDIMAFQNYKKLGLRSNIKILAIGPVPMPSYDEEVTARKNKGLDTPNMDEINKLYKTLFFHNNKRILKEYDGKKENLNEKELNELISDCKLYRYSTSIDSIYYFIRPSGIWDSYTPFIYFRNNESIKLMNQFLNQICAELFNFSINNGVSNYSIKNIIKNNVSNEQLTRINTSYSSFYPALDRDLSFTVIEPTNLFDNLNKIFKNEHNFYSLNSFNVPVSNNLFNFIYDKNGDSDDMVRSGKINDNLSMYINLNSFEYSGKSIYRIKYVENLNLEDIQKIKKYKLISN
jgi:hypothetical protein